MKHSYRLIIWIVFDFPVYPKPQAHQAIPGVALTLWLSSGPAPGTHRCHLQQPGPGALAQAALGTQGSGHDQLSGGKHPRVWASRRDHWCPLNFAHKVGRGPGLSRGSSKKRAPTELVSAAGLRRGRAACGSCPAPLGLERAPSRRAARRPPGFPRPPRAHCGRSRRPP